jgi:hypothetical protein
VLSALLLTVACGKKGPPLPPLVKLPTAPPDLVAARRGATVDLQFTVPGTNTDGTRPANVERVEVYAITAPPDAPPQALTDDRIVKFGTRIDVVAVKAPRDPNLTADPDDPSDEVEPPEGKGLDQGAVAHVAEEIDSDAFEVVKLPADPLAPGAHENRDETSRPLLGPPATPPSRTYAVVGISTRGRKGPMSKRVAVPLVPPPPPPTAPTIIYTERAVTVTWDGPDAAEEATDDVLPSRPLGAPRPSIAYNVYDTTDPDAALKLTASPSNDATFSDTRMTWGAKRCYAVRATEKIDNATIESDAGPATCETLVDTFPPAAPKGLAAIASDRAINLIWEPNAESDFAGYIVLRGVPHEGTKESALEPITPSPITETRFTDSVASGATYVYAVKAVDRAGNVSAASAPITETAR